MSLPLVRLREASVGYPGVEVLRGLDLTINAGERVAIMGRSGAGKTTLLNVIFEHLAKDVALIPQAAALVKTLSVFHNVYMGRLDRYPTWRNLMTLARPTARDKDEVRTILSAVGLADKLFAKAGALSGGQQQRVSVARALYNGRPIVIGDEPVSALDAAQGDRILSTLCSRHETVVLALHDVAAALAHAERVLVLVGGRIALDAPSRDLVAADLAPLFAADKSAGDLS